jgi:hypothetical protein
MAAKRKEKTANNIQLNYSENCDKKRKRKSRLILRSSADNQLVSVIHFHLYFPNIK